MSKPIVIDQLAAALAAEYGSKNGFSVTVEDGGEFGENNRTARMRGPAFPPNGLPFCIPVHQPELWANRLLMQFGLVYEIGKARAVSADGARPAQAASPEVT